MAITNGCSSLSIYYLANINLMTGSDVIKVSASDEEFLRRRSVGGPQDGRGVVAALVRARALNPGRVLKRVASAAAADGRDSTLRSKTPRPTCSKQFSSTEAQMVKKGVSSKKGLNGSNKEDSRLVKCLRKHVPI